LNDLSLILVVLGLWLIIDGVLSIIKYSKQSFPEQLIRAIRTIVGIVIIIVGMFKINKSYVERYSAHCRVQS